MAKTKLDLEVYRLVRRAARDGRCLTVSEVAREVKAARSSVYRVASHYGYESWVAFTNGLVRYYSEAAANDSVARVVEAVADAVLRHRGRPILIDAIGDAEISAMYLQYRLDEQGFMSMIYTRGIASVWAASTATAGSNEAGLLIVINESGTSLLRTVLDATACGYETVAITSSHDTPISKVCDINVVIKNNKSTIDAYEPNYFAAGTLAFVERLLRAIAMEPPDFRPSDQGLSHAFT